MVVTILDYSRFAVSAVLAYYDNNLALLINVITYLLTCVNYPDLLTPVVH